MYMPYLSNLQYVKIHGEKIVEYSSPKAVLSSFSQTHKIGNIGIITNFVFP